MYDDLNKIKKNDKKSLPPSVIFIHSFKDINKVIMLLETKKDVIVNVSNLDRLSKIRVIDFLSGYIYAKNGNKEMYEKNIYLFSN